MALPRYKIFSFNHIEFYKPFKESKMESLEKAIAISKKEKLELKEELKMQLETMTNKLNEQYQKHNRSTISVQRSFEKGLLV